MRDTLTPLAQVHVALLLRDSVSPLSRSLVDPFALEETMVKDTKKHDATKKAEACADMAVDDNADHAGVGAPSATPAAAAPQVKMASD